MYSEANEKVLVDIDKLLEKSFSVPGFHSKVVSTWDICSAEKIRAIPVSDCKKCEHYVPKEQIDPSIKKNKGNDIQTVQKTNVVGEWELYDYDIGCYRNVGFACSNCHTEYGNEMFYSNNEELRYKYCPTCGAKMSYKG